MSPRRGLTRTDSPTDSRHATSTSLQRADCSHNSMSFPHSTPPPGDLSSQEHNSQCIHSKQYSVPVCDMAGYHSGFVQHFRLLRSFPKSPRNVARSAFILQRFRDGLRSGERKVPPVHVKRVYRAVQKQLHSSSPSSLHV